jgi:hypothetical protein
MPRRVTQIDAGRTHGHLHDFLPLRSTTASTGFPGWLPPLPKPVQRQFRNPFTGEITTVETRKPEWPDGEDAENMDSEYQVMEIQGNYQDYLVGRLPPFVQRQPHWAAKGLTEVELIPLAEALGVEAKFECPLFAPPSFGAVLQELPSEFNPKLVSLDQGSLQAIAEKWAATMSTPEYTHSVSGERLNDGWTVSEAIEILYLLVELARQGVDQRMYLLIEV